MDTPKIYSVYAYAFPDGMTYIGLTKDPKQRDYHHKTGGLNSCVLKYAAEKGFEFPELEILESNLSLMEGEWFEGAFINSIPKEFRLNKMRSGIGYGKTGTPKDRCQSSYERLNRLRKYRKTHIEERLEYEQKYRESHKERITENNKSYYERHKEEIRLANKLRYEKKKSEIRAQKRRYLSMNKEAVNQRRRENYKWRKALEGANRGS